MYPNAEMDESISGTRGWKGLNEVTSFERKRNDFLLQSLLLPYATLERMEKVLQVYLFNAVFFLFKSLEYLR